MFWRSHISGGRSPWRASAFKCGWKCSALEAFSDRGQVASGAHWSICTVVMMNYCTYLTVQIFSRLSKKYIGISDHNLPAMGRISIIPSSAQIKTGSTTWHGPNDSPKRLTQPIPAQHNLSISIIPNYCSSSMRQRDRRMFAGCRCSSFCSVSWSLRGQNSTVKQTSMKKKVNEK